MGSNKIMKTEKISPQMKFKQENESFLKNSKGWGRVFFVKKLIKGQE